MPLIHGKSKKAFEKNVSTEMHSGKPQKQSLAIAYNIQRQAKKKAAKGGVAHELPEVEHEEGSTADRILARKKMAQGGMVDLKEVYDEPEVEEELDFGTSPDSLEEEPSEAQSRVDSIRHKMKMKARLK